jgi:hypothetical protein
MLETTPQVRIGRTALELPTFHLHRSDQAGPSHLDTSVGVLSRDERPSLIAADAEELIMPCFNHLVLDIRGGSTDCVTSLGPRKYSYYRPLQSLGLPYRCQNTTPLVQAKSRAPLTPRMRAS